MTTALEPERAFVPNGFFTELEPNSAGSVMPVLTVLLRNRRCPWRCIYCDLWKDMLDQTVPEGAIPAQIDAALRGAGHGARHTMKLYNGGSFFDRAAIPLADHAAIAMRGRSFQRVIVENHPSLTGDAVPRFRESLGDTDLEVAMGLEIADDAILRRLNRRMTLEDFRRAATLLSRHDIATRAFVMVKPPFVKSQEEGIRAAVASAEFAFDCGATVVSLIPARPGTDALNELARRGEFAPPQLETVERSVEGALRLGRGLVFTDLWNLTAAGACEGCFPARKERLHGMNLKQTMLPVVHCECQASARVLRA